MQFHKRLKIRGWDKITLDLIFTVVRRQLLSKQERTNKIQVNEISTRDRMILHSEFHPDDIQHKIVHDLWSKDCGEYLSEHIEDGGIGIKQTIIAYSRQKHLRDVLQKARLYQLPGKEVSSYF